MKTTRAAGAARRAPYYSAPRVRRDHRRERAAPTPPPDRAGGSHVNTAIFALATGALADRRARRARSSQASFFGTTAAASAFTIASQVPNLFSNLFAQAALSAAFVPVFTELLQQGRKREAFGSPRRCSGSS